MLFRYIVQLRPQAFVLTSPCPTFPRRHFRTYLERADLGCASILELDSMTMRIN